MLPEPDANNVWRLETPGNEGWLRSARPDAADKFYMASADGHVQEPGDLWVDPHRRPATATACPASSSTPRATSSRRPRASGRPGCRTCRSKATSCCATSRAARPRTASRDLALDGVDAEVLFPNKGLTMWATPGRRRSARRCAGSTTTGRGRRSARTTTRSCALACVATADIDGAIAEIQRCAALGFRGLSLPCKPVFGPPEPRGPELQPARVRAAVGLHRGRRPADHVPRVDRPRPAHRPEPGRRRHQLHRALAGADDGAARQHLRVGRGRAPSRSCGSAPSRPASAGCRGRSTAMDEAYRKHHMWVKPKLELLPSEYFHRQGFATLPGGQARASTSPGSTASSTTSCGPTTSRTTRARGRTRRQAIERTMGDLDDAERAKILGLNMARIFRLPDPRALPEPRRRRRHAGRHRGRGPRRERPDAARQGRRRRRRRDRVLQVGPVARSRVQAGHRRRPEGVRRRRHRPARRRRLLVVQQRPQRGVPAVGRARLPAS